MSTTVTYNGSTIAQVNNETKTLLTSGKWLTGNIVLTNVSDDSGSDSVTYITELLCPETTIEVTSNFTTLITGVGLEVGALYRYTVNNVVNWGEGLKRINKPDGDTWVGDVRLFWDDVGPGLCSDGTKIQFTTYERGTFTVKVEKITLLTDGVVLQNKNNYY